jgi:hypothetical protein
MNNIANSANITPESVNARIQNEICEEIISKLSDLSMIEEYKSCDSVKKAVEKLANILTKHNITNEAKDAIIADYLIEIIPAGTKGVMRGNKFNKIIKEHLTNMKLDPMRFEVMFEKQCASCQTTEIPDWYVLEKTTGKVIIGMNQLDLWGGGQQHNRGSKYLLDNKINTDKSKLVCVVCNRTKFDTCKKGTLPKAYKYFEIFRLSGHCHGTL